MKKIVIFLLFLFLPLQVVYASYTSHYPPEQSDTYVKATSTYGGGQWLPHFATDPTKSLTAGWNGNNWLALSSTPYEQWFQIDLGSTHIIQRIYYENSHHAGGYTGSGVKNFVFYGSNDPDDFGELDYDIIGNWVELTTSQSTFDEHIGSDIADPKYITVTNSTGYRYYGFRFADHYDLDEYMGARRIELQELDETPTPTPSPSPTPTPTTYPQWYNPPTSTISSQITIPVKIWTGNFPHGADDDGGWYTPDVCQFGYVNGNNPIRKDCLIAPDLSMFHDIADKVVEIQVSFTSMENSTNNFRMYLADDNWNATYTGVLKNYTDYPWPYAEYINLTQELDNTITNKILINPTAYTYWLQGEHWSNGNVVLKIHHSSEATQFNETTSIPLITVWYKGSPIGYNPTGDYSAQFYSDRIPQLKPRQITDCPFGDLACYFDTTIKWIEYIAGQMLNSTIKFLADAFVPDAVVYQQNINDLRNEMIARKPYAYIIGLTDLTDFTATDSSTIPDFDYPFTTYYKEGGEMVEAFHYDIHIEGSEFEFIHPFINFMKTFFVIVLWMSFILYLVQLLKSLGSSHFFG